MLDRRQFLGAGAAGAAALALPMPAHAAAKAPAGGRIDLHAHHIPPVYRAALLKAGMVTIGGYPTPIWTPERALGFMDSYGIQLQVLSLSDPGVSFLSGAPARTLARQVNEYTAELIKDHPTDFGGYAVLPLPDVAASLEELRYALDVLRLDGVALLTSYNGANIAMPQFELLWAELNRRKAFVFMHPATLAADDKPSYVLPDFLVEFTFETTRFCALAITTQLPVLFPNVRIQLAHAGGAYPFLDYRVHVIQNGLGVPTAPPKSFYYDTAINPAPAAMRSVLEVSDVDHVVFGSDWPFTELLFLGSGDPQPLLSKTFDGDQRAAIERGNALRQLPGVAARLGSPPADTSVDAELIRARVVDGRVRFLLDTKEIVLVDARLTRAGKALARKRFARVDRGRRTLHFALPQGVKPGKARLALAVTDTLGNTTTIRRSVRV
jgi:predicted TIM-barrel fold metal-dependent hydrolase